MYYEVGSKICANFFKIKLVITSGYISSPLWIVSYSLLH